MTNESILPKLHDHREDRLPNFQDFSQVEPRSKDDWIVGGVVGVRNRV